MTRGRNKPIRPKRGASKLLPDRHQPVESVENLLFKKGFCQLLEFCSGVHHSKYPGTNVRKINQRATYRHTRESAYPEVFEIPGFRVALATASLPGMTPQLFNGFRK